MKHTFDCGIVGSAHDVAGIAFLAGMMRKEAEEQRTAPVIARAAQRRLESNLKDARRVIAARARRAVASDVSMHWAVFARKQAPTQGGAGGGSEPRRGP